MNTKSTKLIFICFLVIFSTISYSLAMKPVQLYPVNVVGIGAVVDDNKTIARGKALDDALRKAVVQAVGTFVSSETIVESHTLLSERIYAKSEGYIQNYKIISESLIEDIYKVNIEATVVLGSLKDDLSTIGLLMARKYKPRVIVMIAEQNIGQEHFSFWWDYHTSPANLSITETTLIEIFKERGFKIVDHGAKAKDIKIDKSYQVANLDDSMAIYIGEQYDAEVVIIGKAMAKRTEKTLDTSMKSCEANISARAIRTDNGAIIASENTKGIAAHINEFIAGSNALKKGASDLATKLMDQIIGTWEKELTGTTLVQMTISGISSYHDFIALKNTIKEEIRGIKGVYQRSIMAGIAKIDIDIKGDAQSLAQELTKKDFQSFSIDVDALTQNSIDITLYPKNP
ncbi:MAG: hypothetical protein SWO11_11870 [Thermodesulfobacteriota bacterium]|nr:hypothetical protein [Thermodesulfobacteriota bacterium]